MSAVASSGQYLWFALQLRTLRCTFSKQVSFDKENKSVRFRVEFECLFQPSVMIQALAPTFTSSEKLISGRNVSDC